MSFWKKLFGGGAEAEPAPQPAEEYNGFLIRAAPYKENGQYQMCGHITKEINGETKEHRFVRADRFASLDDAVQFTLLKARQIIDQNGERVFK